MQPKILITIDWEDYNGRRFSRPWIAKVSFNLNGECDFHFGNYLGTNEGGKLVLGNVDNGDIVAYGQKDNYGKRTQVNYHAVEDGKLGAKMTKGKAYTYYASHLQA